MKVGRTCPANFRSLWRRTQMAPAPLAVMAAGRGGRGGMHFVLRALARSDVERLLGHVVVTRAPFCERDSRSNDRSWRLPGSTAAAPSASEAAASATAVLVNMTSLLCRNDHRRVGGWGKGGATAIRQRNAGALELFPRSTVAPRNVAARYVADSNCRRPDLREGWRAARGLEPDRARRATGLPCG